MTKQTWKPGNMLYPLPAVMVSVTDGKGEDDIITVAWTGTICTNPPMVYISVRPERHSYHMIKETGEFVINLTTEKLAKATDFCGVRSGRDVDKFKETGLTREKADIVSAPMIQESPVSIECKVKEIKELGSHHMFLADVVAVHADEHYMDENNRFDLNLQNHLFIPMGNIWGLESSWERLDTASKRRKKRRKKHPQKAAKPDFKRDCRITVFMIKYKLSNL